MSRRDAEYLWWMTDQNKSQEPDDGEISSFSDTPAPSTETKELESAEDQTQQETREKIQQDKDHTEQQEEKADELAPEGAGDDEIPMEEDEDTATLRQMTPDQISFIRFMPISEYGTPSGVDSPSSYPYGCPDCQDAADAAIIDAEISPADATEDGDETAGDFGESSEDDFSAELLGYFRSRDYMLDIIARGREEYPLLPGEEGIFSAAKAILSFVGEVLLRITKYSRKCWQYVRNNYVISDKHISRATKFWNFKLRNSLDKVDVERLSGYEVEAWPFATWQEVCKVAISASELVESSTRIVFDSAEVATTSMMRNFISRLENIGVSINVAKNRIEMDDLLDKRAFESVPNLGFTKSNIPVALRYLAEISQRLSDSVVAASENTVKEVTKRITSEAARLSEALDKDEIKKNSPEYLKATDTIMNYSVRLDFILNLQRLAATLFSKLTDDVSKVFTKYEDSMTWSRIVD